jgi:hypothetical protein
MPPRRSKVIEAPAAAVVQAQAETPALVPVPRKSKKAIKVVAVVTANGIEGNFAPEPRRPLIAHLQIHSSEVKFHDAPISYDPAPPLQPEPYDFSADNFFFSKQESLDEKVEEEKVEAVPEKEEKVDSSAPMPAFVRSGLLVQFRASSDARELPSSSDVSCFWCTQPFEGQPCIIPEREDKGLWRVYGNFCCPECGVSYLLNESIDPHVRWERMALLHRLYDPEGLARIFPAPPRESLKFFGGPMSIETFRATTRVGKVRVDIHMPPMVSILGSIDTKPIDFFDSNMKNTLQEKGPIKTEEGLRLKRSKPLKDRDSTLDSVMNIQIRGGKR